MSELPVYADQPITRGAVLSDDGVYRYSLTRTWPDDQAYADTVRPVVWVMINPSTADHEVDDATIRRCIGFTRAFGYRTLTVVNLFALRATDPRELARHPDPIGPLNTAALIAARELAGLVICAWGADPMARERAAGVHQLFAEGGQPVHCLGRTKSGAPRHPLYLPSTARPEVFT